MHNTTEANKSEIISRSRDLRDQIKGKVYVAGDEGYDRARQGWNLAVVQHPLLVVEATCVEDVQAAVRFAGEAGLPIGVMATGHGLPRTCDGGLLIRTSAMNAVQVDATTRRARVQGGAKFQDVFSLCQPHGLAPLSGSAPHVGVVGYLLGGGFGLLLRQYGLGIDSVRSATIVTADAEVVTASRDQNSDLFWAILGGGGSFGVIAEVEMELYPVATVFGGATIYPAENLTEIYRAFAAWTRDLPDSVSSCIQLMNLPPLPIVPEPLRGKAVVNINACVCGDPSKAEELVRPMRELGTPILDMWGEFPYAESGRIFNDPIDPLPACGQGVLLHDLTEDTIERLLTSVGPAEESPQINIQLRHLGGAMNRVSPESSPVGNRRSAKYLIYMLSVPNPHVPHEAIRNHAEGVISGLGEHVLCRGPLNFLGEGDVASQSVQSCFDEESHRRLEEIKRARDPHNRFRLCGIGLCE